MTHDRRFDVWTCPKCGNDLDRKGTIRLARRRHIPLDQVTPVCNPCKLFFAVTPELGIRPLTPGELFRHHLEHPAAMAHILSLSPETSINILARAE